jgi:hypothetical protein
MFFKYVLVFGGLGNGGKLVMEPVKFEEIYSGMRLWDNENKRWQKVLRVSLWEKIIKENPNKFFTKKQ